MDKQATEEASRMAILCDWQRFNSLIVLSVGEDVNKQAFPYT